MNDSPEQIPSEPIEARTHTRVQVRRSPKYVTFIVLGAAIGLIAAVILTLAFPENDKFTPLQVFGFVALVSVVIGVAMFCCIALILDRVVGRKVRVVEADKLYVHPADSADAEQVQVPPTTTEGNHNS